MVTLNSQQQRNSANIDSLEKLSVYACQVLRSVLVKSDNSNLNNKAISFAFRDNIDQSKSILIDAKLPYSSYLFNQFGGYFLNSIQELSIDPPPPLNFVCAINQGFAPNFPNVPIAIQTFEQLLYWTSSILFSSASLGTGKVEIKPFDSNSSNAYLQINLSFLLDSNILFLGGNVLNALLPYTETYNLNYSQLTIFSEAVTIQESNFEIITGELTDGRLLSNNQLLVDSLV